MGQQHPTGNHWGTGSEEHTRMTCSSCGVSVEGLTDAADFGVGTSHKCFFFYEFSSADITTSVSAGASASKSDGPGVNAGFSVTIKEGTPLIKFFRMDGWPHTCTACFARDHEDVLKSVALTIKGKAAIINSDMTLNSAAYGDF